MNNTTNMFTSATQSVAAALALVVAILAGCGGGEAAAPVPTGSSEPSPGSPTEAGPIARIEVSPTAVLLTGPGKTQRIAIRAFDSNGMEIPGPAVSIASNRPAEVVAAADGTLTAGVAVGSALIQVRAGAVAAKPILVVVAEPAPAAVLVSDEQVVAAPVAVDPNAVGRLGFRMKATLSGVGTLQAGAIVIGTGGQPLGGRVVSTTPSGGNTEVVLELVALPELFKNLKVHAEYSVEDTKRLFEPAPTPLRLQPQGRVRKASGIGTGPCEAEPKPSLSAFTGELEFKVEHELTAIVAAEIENFTPKSLLVSVAGSVEGAGKATLGVGLTLVGGVSCKWLLGAIVIPVTGPLSLILAPIVPIEAKLELSGQLGASAFSFGAEVKQKAAFEIGLKYLEESGLQPIKSFTVDEPEFNRTMTFPTEASVRVKANAFIGVAASIALGGVLARLDIVELSAGPEFEAKFGGPFDVSQDTIYNTEYELKGKIEVGPGKYIGDFIEKFFLSSKAIDLSAKREWSIARTALPRQLEINRERFSAGERVTFKVSLDPSTVKFPLVGYNVKQIQIHRLDHSVPGFGTSTMIADAVAGPDQTEFKIDWIAESNGDAIDSATGKVNFFAFLVDQPLSVVSAVFPFELGEIRPASSVGPPRLAGTGTSWMAIGPDGKLRSLGTNNGGALGAGLPIGERVTSPVPVVGINNVVSVTGSAWFGWALLSDGSVWSWGWGPSIGMVNDDNPVPVKRGAARYIWLSSGYKSTAVVREDGKVIRMGNTGTHASVEGRPGTIAAAEGLDHSLFLTSDGKVYGWGSNAYGQVGSGTDESRHDAAVEVVGLTDVIAIAAGNYFSVALMRDGTVWAWGANGGGRLGIGPNISYVRKPTQVVGLANVKRISTGETHALALDSVGQAYAWGVGLYCRLGTGDSTDRFTPTLVLTDVWDIDGAEFGSLFAKGVSVWRAGRVAGEGDACVPVETALQAPAR